MGQQAFSTMEGLAARLSTTTEGQMGGGRCPAQAVDLDHPLDVKFDYAPAKEMGGLRVSGLYGKAKLRENDVILSVNGKMLKNLEGQQLIQTFKQAIENAHGQGDKLVKLRILKGKEKMKEKGKEKAHGISTSIAEGAKAEVDSKSMKGKKLLPLPPKKIKLVLWDMDNTLLSMHTRGVWFNKVEDLFEHVTLPFLQLVPRLLKEGFQVGVVTFSDAEVAKIYSEMEGRKGRGGEDLVGPVIHGAITQAALSSGVDSKTATQSATKTVEQLYVVGALPDFRNMHTVEFQKKRMPMSKFWHIEKVKDLHQKRFPGSPRIKNEEILFFDDSASNICAAERDDVNARLVDPSNAFTEKDWLEAIEALQKEEKS